MLMIIFDVFRADEFRIMGENFHLKSNSASFMEWIIDIVREECEKLLLSCLRPRLLLTEDWKLLKLNFSSFLVDVLRGETF